MNFLSIFCLFNVQLFTFCYEGNKESDTMSCQSSDVIFIMDTSQNLDLNTFQFMLHFVANLTDTFVDSTRELNLGAIAYNDIVNYSSKMSQSSVSLHNFMDKVLKWRQSYKTEVSNTNLALLLSLNWLEFIRQNCGPTTSVVVLLTCTPHSPKTVNPINSAQKLQKLGTTILAVQVAESITSLPSKLSGELLSITGHHNHVFNATPENVQLTLHSIVNLLESKWKLLDMADALNPQWTWWLYVLITLGVLLGLIIVGIASFCLIRRLRQGSIGPKPTSGTKAAPWVLRAPPKIPPPKIPLPQKINSPPAVEDRLDRYSTLKNMGSSDNGSCMPMPMSASDTESLVDGSRNTYDYIMDTPSQYRSVSASVSSSTRQTSGSAPFDTSSYTSALFI